MVEKWDYGFRNNNGLLMNCVENIDFEFYQSKFRNMLNQSDNFTIDTTDTTSTIHLLFPGVIFYPAIIIMYIVCITEVSTSSVVLYVYFRSKYFRTYNPMRRIFVLFSTTCNFLVSLHVFLILITLSVSDQHIIPSTFYNITCTTFGILTMTAIISDVLSYPIQAYDRVIKLTQPLNIEKHLTVKAVYQSLFAAAIFAAFHAVFPVIFTMDAYSNNPICLPFYSIRDENTTPAVMVFIGCFLFLQVFTTSIDIALIAIIYHSIRVDIKNCTTEECRTTKYGVLRKLVAQACEELIVVAVVVIILILLPDSSWGMGLILITTSIMPAIDLYTLAFRQKTFFNETRKIFFKKTLISFE